MRQDSKFYRCVLLLIVFACAAIGGFAQDLGSSSKIFDSKNSKTKTEAKAAAKKAAPKAKPAAAKKLAAKPATVTAKKIDNAAPKKPTVNKAAPNSPGAAKKSLNDVIITVGQPAAPAKTVEPSKTIAVKADADDVFEKSIEEGNQARDEREYVKAEAAYLKAQSLKTKDARAIYGLGNLYSDQQRWEEAEAAYRLAIKFDPKSPDAYIALSYVLTQPLVGMELGGRYAEAENLARQAISLDGKNAFAYDQLGVALELGGEVGDETNNSYRRAIQLDSNFALAYAHLGRLLRRIGQNKESSAAYRAAIQKSTDAPTMIMVADVMQSQQHYLESEELLRRALRRDPKNPTALFLLGRALTTRGSFDEAEKVLKKSAAVSPKSFISYALLGSLYTRRGDFDEAEKSLQQALKMVSINERKRLAQDFEAVGDGLARAGKKQDAVRLYRQAMALDRDKVALSQKLAKVL